MVSDRSARRATPGRLRQYRHLDWQNRIWYGIPGILRVGPLFSINIYGFRRRVETMCGAQQNAAALIILKTAAID